MWVPEIGKKILQYIAEWLQLLFWHMEALYRNLIPPPMQSIDNETILVTGAVGGIGKELCRYLVQSGTNLTLVIWDLNQEDLEIFADELKASGAVGLNVFPMAVDISSRDNIDKACIQMKETFGPATIIFNNAGISEPGTFLQHSNEDIEKITQVNFLSHLWIIRQFLPDMLTNNHGRIVNICSMGGLSASTHGLPYFASKFAVNGYTESLKLELRLPYYNYTGIKLTTVYPYYVQTPMIRSMAINNDTEVLRYLPKPFRKVLTPEEVAKKTVDGMRREYEYIYVPWSIPMVLFFEWLIPMKQRRFNQSKYLNTMCFKNPVEYDRIVKMPYAGRLDTTFEDESKKEI